MLQKTVSEIIARRVYGLTPARSVADALELMRRQTISCVVVLEDDRPVGIYTERDVIAGLARMDQELLACPLSQAMSFPVITITADTPAWEAYNLLIANRKRHLVIVDEQGRAVGVLTQSNLIAHLGYEYYVEVKRIARIMTRTVHTVPPDYPARKATEDMVHESLSCVVVSENGVPRGIVTERDVARALADRRDFDALRIDELMSTPVMTINHDSPVHEAALLMQRNGFRRLVVVDRDGALKGLITQTDIVRGLESKYIDILKNLIAEKNSRLESIGRDLSIKSSHLNHILRSALNVGIAALDTEGHITYFNPTAERIFGVGAGEVTGKKLDEVHALHDVDPGRIQRAIENVNTVGSHEFTLELPRGETVCVVKARVSAILDEYGKLLGHALMVNDITRQRKAEETIRFMAYHDMLTGLPNRSLFNDRLNHELLRARRSDRLLAIMMLDLDRFKEVNDTFGHSVGDDLLKDVAGRLAEALRASDTVARMGGDEFLFLAPDLHSVEEVTTVAGRILSCLDQPFLLAGTSVAIGGSLGIAMFPGDGDSLDTLTRCADRAMYEAKRRGTGGTGSQYLFYSALASLPPRTVGQEHQCLSEGVSGAGAGSSADTEDSD